MSNQVTRRGLNTGLGAALLSPALAAVPAFAQGGEPIKIGFSMAQTGSLAGAGLAPRPVRAKAGRRRSLC